MGHRVVVNQVSFQRFHEGCWYGVQSSSIVDTGVVDQNINAAESFQSFLDGNLARVGISQVSLNEQALAAQFGVLFLQSLSFRFAAINVCNLDAFCDERSNDSQSDAF